MGWSRMWWTRRRNMTSGHVRGNITMLQDCINLIRGSGTHLFFFSNNLLHSRSPCLHLCFLAAQLWDHLPLYHLPPLSSTQLWPSSARNTCATMALSVSDTALTHLLGSEGQAFLDSCRLIFLCSSNSWTTDWSRVAEFCGACWTSKDAPHNRDVAYVPQSTLTLNLVNKHFLVGKACFSCCVHTSFCRFCSGVLQGVVLQLSASHRRWALPAAQLCWEAFLQLHPPPVSFAKVLLYFPLALLAVFS